MSFDFTGQSVIVTGAAQGIGLEMARFFVDAGATTYLVDYDEAALAAAAEETGGRGVRADVAATDDVEAVVRRVIEETGRVDVLVNNAGILRDTVVWKLSDDDWDAVLSVHAGGTFRFTRACVPHFRAQRYGRVINVTSYTGLHGNVGQANYATAKAGIIGFTKTAAKELAGFGVTVNAISPNARTRMIDSIPAERVAELTATIPLGRFSEPAEVCPTVGFLAAAESGYVTGVVLPVDGGISI
ncbi:SDR family NAD(P)-dependent oxidoreductase [Streptomyces sp. SRF1]|uniref:SDR family oxidoreductase n=1 Tax=Streptomyces sp. SRF1 TaxID=1549642 RepID=UPI0025B11039|nr:SDR family NAD(P)-dependent oxidoreductase [Streptomyces sp. SRF1]MDN3059003.1 SDR family NAD(P)-dependent oxidoreductase [Streptomyces sp. SRF1]